MRGLFLNCRQPKLQAAYVIESLWLERDKAKLSLWIGDRRKVPAVMDAIFWDGKEA